ncbi:MAG: L-threonylcarbamoyladenylate synthase [Thermodesulfobacteriota bacterium]|nr:L-threonylcarbamoyladenylate synthase [Thermodesulfobacteriota bacterium]
MYKNTKIVKIDPLQPEKELIERAGNIIKNGGIVVFPAKHLYGIAVDAWCMKAVKKVFEIKQRSLTNPLLVLINEKEDLKKLIKSEPEQARALMAKFWPGDITIVFNARDDIPKLLTANTGKIGIRMPSHPVAKALVKEAGIPVTGTSANISDAKGTHRIKDLNPRIIKMVDMVLDAGELKEGRGSTVVDVTHTFLKVLRPGEVSIHGD